MSDVVEKAGDPWAEVTVRETGEVYYWNRATGASLFLTKLLWDGSQITARVSVHLPGSKHLAGETTAVGEPRPTAAGRVQQQVPQFQQPVQGEGLGLGRLLAMGKPWLRHGHQALLASEVPQEPSIAEDASALCGTCFCSMCTGAGMGLAFGLLGKLLGG